MDRLGAFQWSKKKLSMDKSGESLNKYCSRIEIPPTPEPLQV